MKKELKILAVALCSLALIACSSGVKLDTPVDDKSNSMGDAAAGANASGVNTSGITAVNIDATNSTVAGPANVEKIIYFDYDSYQVRPEFANAIAAHARFLIANKNRTVALEGHTDNRGGREYNLALGQRRAEAVRQSLSLLGVSDQQIEAVSFGKEKPLNLGFSEEAHAQNRRVEIRYR